MASGKSLELAAIKPGPPVPICICTLEWPKHLDKTGKRRLKKYDNQDHMIAGNPGNTARWRSK